MGGTQANIAKNTLFLYFRMFFIMIVTLFTSRIILKTLGVEDYGIYNVVGGVVALFGFLNSSMSATTQRYIAFAIGEGDCTNLRNIFSTCIITHFAIALIVLLFVETIGLWFIFNKLVIPDNRLSAALWVFHCTAISTAITIMSVPYNADIIAHEKMEAFAYISIVEVTLKLLVVYLISVSNYDKLLLYGILLLVVQIVIMLAYQSYSIYHFEESKSTLHFDKVLFKDMFSFAGWNLCGNLSSILFVQGLNILLNLFFGPTVNAAKAIANQIDGAVKQFAISFQMALNPQIIKSYASGNLETMHELIYWSSKITFFLLLIISLPVFFEASMILYIWLDIVPDWTASFVRILLVIMILDSVANPLMTAVSATGKVKIYQSVIGGILLFIVPISFVVLSLGGNPISVFIVHLGVCILAFIARLYIVKPLIGLSLRLYINTVVAKCLFTLFSSALIPLVLRVFFPQTLLYSLLNIFVSILSVCFCSYVFGMTTAERIIVKTKVSSYKSKLFR